MANTIKVGVITHEGGAHLSAYFDSLASSPDVESVALADADGASVALAEKSLGKKFGRAFKDAGEMLRETRPAMALVSMEASLSPPAIDAALDAGCHVLSEKPACVAAADFERLVRKAQSKHLHLMLALANRLSPAVQEARRLVRTGMLGKIYGVELHLIADQTRLKAAEYHRSWRATKARAGGGHLIWLGIHWLDLSEYITGLAVKDVAAFTTVIGGQPIDAEDSAVAALRFNNGALGTITSGYYLDKGYHSNIRVWGEQGWLRLALTEDQPLEWYSTQTKPAPRVERFEYPKDTRGYTPFVHAAVRAAAGLAESPITGSECLHVLRTIFACYRSAETGRMEPVGGGS